MNLELQRYTARGYNNLYVFDGVLLGEASSYRDIHSNHPESFALPGQRCSACRWFEVKIYREDAGDYLIELAGKTNVPTEKDRHRVEQTSSPHAIIDLLTQQDNGRPFIPLVSRRVLAEASAHDTAIEEVYIRRVVA